jgi:MurNAc alpha-1-phosphate uridylyltransferase
MKAFILAAGLGERLRPLTDTKPKPLIEVGGSPLILWHIKKLREAGITDLVINCHWLAEQLIDSLGDGSALGINIVWSREPELLNTGGGIAAALPSLGEEPFALVSADIWTDFDYGWLTGVRLVDRPASLVVVPAPDFAPQGDFVLGENSHLRLDGSKGPIVTYAGIGVLHPSWVKEWTDESESGAFSWTGPLRQAVEQGRIAATLHEGRWTDVGTPERLAQLEQELNQNIGEKS